MTVRPIDGMSASRPCVYAGLAGDTEAGRFLSSGLYRSLEFDGAWEPLADRFDTPVQVRAILTHPARAGWVLIGTQFGILRSDDFGDHWRLLPAPRPGVAIWSLTRSAADGNTLIAGYEPCVLYRSTDDGASWEELPVNASFPSVTVIDDQPKRVTSVAVDPHAPKRLYATVEVGGLLCTHDAGLNWTSVIDGLYVTDDAVDLHQVLIDPRRAGVLTVATRVGLFRSRDGGAGWCRLPVPATSARGVYCRSVAYAPDDPQILYLGAGEGFEGDAGMLFLSRDGGENWSVPAYGLKLKSTVFAVATDSRYPSHVYFASKYGEVLRSTDHGSTWVCNPLPRGVGHVFSLAVG